MENIQKKNNQNIRKSTIEATQRLQANKRQRKGFQIELWSIIIDHNKYKLQMNSQRTHVGSYKVIKEIASEQRFKLTKVCLQEQQYLIRSYPIMTFEDYQKPDCKRKCDRLLVRCSKYIEIRHPHIQRITACFIEEDTTMIFIHVVVEQSTSSGNLLEFIENRSHFHHKKLKRLMVNMASALRELHCQNIIHSTINVHSFKGDDQSIKLIFLSLHEIGQFQKANLNLENIEQIYLAPEILQNEGYDISVDIWSLGLVFLQLITGTCVQQGSTLRKAAINQGDLIKELPNRLCLELIQGMLEPTTFVRLTIEQVEQLLQRIHFQPSANTHETYPNLGHLYETFSLNLFQTPEQQTLPLYKPQRQSSLQTSIEHSIKTKHYAIIFLYDPIRDTILLHISFLRRNMRTITTEVDFSTVSYKVKEFFGSLSDFFNQIRTCNSERVRLGSDGTITLFFDKERCDILQEIIISENQPIKNAKKHEKMKTQPIKQKSPEKREISATNEQKHKNSYKTQVPKDSSQQNQAKTSSKEPIYFDPSPTYPSSKKQEQKQSFYQPFQEDNYLSDQENYEKQRNLYRLADQYFRKTNFAFKSSNFQQTIKYGEQCLKTAKQLQVSKSNILVLHYWLSFSYRKTLQYAKCYEISKIGQKIASEQETGYYQRYSLTYRQSFFVSIIYVCIIEKNYKLFDVERELAVKIFPKTYTTVMIIAYYYVYMEQIHKTKYVAVNFTQQDSLFNAIKYFVNQIKTMDQRAIFYLSQFAQIIFTSGALQHYDVAITIFTKIYHFIKDDLQNIENENTFNQIMNIILIVVGNPRQPKGRQKLLAWVEENIPDKLEILLSSIDDTQQID